MDTWDGFGVTMRSRRQENILRLTKLQGKLQAMGLDQEAEDLQRAISQIESDDPANQVSGKGSVNQAYADVIKPVIGYAVLAVGSVAAVTGAMYFFTHL